MLVHAHGFAIARGVAEHVNVELDTRSGLPGFSVIGLGVGAARDARERVHAAVLNSGFGFPRKRVTVNLAPPPPRDNGPAFDLTLACCVLAVQEHIDTDRVARIGLYAELGLGGDLRHCEHAAIVAEAAGLAGLAGLIVAAADLPEARAAGALPVAGVGSLRQAAALLARAERRAPPRSVRANQGLARQAGAGRRDTQPQASRGPDAAATRPSPPRQLADGRTGSPPSAAGGDARAGRSVGAPPPAANAESRRRPESGR